MEMTTQYKGDIDIMNPKVEFVDIRDIANALSKICRFGGHSPKFYSVAEHCLLVHDLVPEEYKLMGLMHDATEAYVMDMIRPIKIHMKEFNDLEQKWFQVIVDKFNLNKSDIDIVKKYDQTALHIEFQMFFNQKNSNLIHFYEPEMAEELFLKKFNEYDN